MGKHEQVFQSFGPVNQHSSLLLRRQALKLRHALAGLLAGANSNRGWRQNAQHIKPGGAGTRRPVGCLMGCCGIALAEQDVGKRNRGTGAFRSAFRAVANQFPATAFRFIKRAGFDGTPNLFNLARDGLALGHRQSGY
ncbi:MAG: hypothetical protein WD397_03405 [Wenzhouxiangellaceae bacterium]